MLTRQLRALLGKDLADESRDLAEWYLDEVGEAETMNRLDELIEEFADERIRPRRWWQATPAIETAGGDHGDDAGPPDGEDGAADDDEDRRPQAIGAAPAPSMDHAAELAARNYWVDTSVQPGWCQITEMTPHGWADLPPQQCGLAATWLFGRARVCTGHYRALTTPLMRRP